MIFESEINDKGAIYSNTEGKFMLFFCDHKIIL